MNTAENIIDSVKIPTLPEVAVRLLSLCNNEHVGAGEIVQTIELDAALSARLLKVANSSYFRQQGKVHTLTRAAVVLGNEYIKAVGLGFQICSGWAGSGAGELDVKAFWYDSVLRACLARQLAKASASHPGEEMFLVGMLQNIGALILATHFQKDYVDFLKSEEGTAIDLCEAEQLRFGTNRAELAGVLAERWRFPDPLGLALRRQYMQPPFMRTQDHGTLLWQIAYFCAAVPFAPDGQTAAVDVTLRHLAISALGLSSESLSDVFTAAVEQFNDVRAVFFDVISDQRDAATLMRQAARLFEEIDTGPIEKTLLS